MNLVVILCRNGNGLWNEWKRVALVLVKEDLFVLVYRKVNWFCIPLGKGNESAFSVFQIRNTEEHKSSL